MKTDYVSEFTLFINQYLAEHPEVVEDQKRGRDIYWNPKVDQEALKSRNTPFRTTAMHGSAEGEGREASSHSD